MSAPSTWNVWSRYDSVIYGIRAHHPNNPNRVIFAYAGKTIQRPWTRRIDQHLWGRGRYGNTAQPWADTVLGWTPTGTTAQVIAAGGVFVIYRGWCTPFGLWWREIAVIWWRRPYYNYQWNQHNPRRVPKPVAQQHRELRDHGMVRTPSPLAALPWAGVRAVAALLALLTLVVMFLPGMPGQTGITTGWEWVQDHQTQLIGWAVLAGAGLMALAGTGPRRRSRR